jgi:peptide/nickel transport system substrate-binding protein
MVAGGWNVNYLFDEELDQLSMDMVLGVEAGDDEAFLDVWQKYIQRWNELLPEVPLYSNMYITVIPDWLENFEMNPFWSFQSAIVGATVRPQG